MLQNWFILLPEFCLLSFFPIAWLVDIFRREKTAKTFFTLAQAFLLLTIGTTILFYDKSAFPSYWRNTALTTLFKIFVYLLAWAWFYLSSKWFLNKKRASFKFYAACFILLLGFDMLASSASLLALGAAVPLICSGYVCLILRHWDIDKVKKPAAAFAVSALSFCALLWIGISFIRFYAGSFEYEEISRFFAKDPTADALPLAGVLMVISALMFMMAVVPFHTWFISFISTAVSPVCGFITLIPPLIYFCALINLVKGGFEPLGDFIVPVLTIFSLLTLITGALSANHENNLRRLFGFLSLYIQGFTLIGVMDFSRGSMMAAFAYIVISVLSLAGIYTVFLGLKSRGEYLSEQADITGFSEIRPYMSAALLVFMFSLIGLAPTLGFFGNLSIINVLIENEAWGRAAILLPSLLFVAGACLQVVGTFYFKPLSNKFDRVDKAVYICLFINMVFILLALINPAWLLRDAFVILGDVS